jgi:hypothetical protein
MLPRQDFRRNTMTAETIAPVADGTNVEGALVCDKALCKKERKSYRRKQIGPFTLSQEADLLQKTSLLYLKHLPQSIPILFVQPPCLSIGGVQRYHDSRQVKNRERG